MKSAYFPDEFVEKFSKLFGTEAKEFFVASKKKLMKSIWVNSLKISPSELLKKMELHGWKLKPLQFHENAFLLENVERPGIADEFKEGLFNLQEISSMLPALVLKPEEGELVLDCAAAPGNKTLQLSCLMNGKGKIYAIDNSKPRFKSLKFNVKKFGMENVVPALGNFLALKTEKKFDKILLDAPCSSEGLVRKDFDALKNWSKNLVERKARLQKKMLDKAFGLLKEGGELVYSTCSLSPEEDEEVVESLLKKFGNAQLKKIKINGIKLRNGLDNYKNRKFNPQMLYCARIMPQDNDSQAFFIAKIKRS